MSASKKKRLGSQRRSLNPNVQESSQTSDKGTSPSLLPQGRQRADANADLTLSTGSTESERKKKLGSQRGNKGKLQFKDVSTESSHKPKEEVEGSTAHSEPMDTLAIKNETINVSLERNVKSISPESEEAGSDLVLADAPNASLSIITDAVSPKADIQDTNMDSTSELLLKAESEKYLADIASTEEGVLSEKGCTQGVPDIFGGPIPAGVIEEGTCPVRLTQNEELNIFGSHDDYNKHNTEDKAGPMEKPVCQDRDMSALPTPKPRKMGSSRRKQVINFEELQERGNEMAVESNIFHALETSNPTNVADPQEANVSVAATEVTYKEESQEENNFSPKENVEDTDEISADDNASLSEIKEFESPPSENILVEIKAKDDHMEEANHGNEQLPYLQNSDLSEIFFESAGGKNVNTMDQPEPSIVDGLNIVYGQANEEKDQDEAVNHTDEQLQREESFDSSLQSVNSAPFSAPVDVSVNDVEAKILEIEEGSLQPEPISQSDTQNFAFERSESSSESISSLKDKVESFFGSVQELKPSKDGVFHLNQDDILHLSSTTESTGDNQSEAGLAKTADVHQITTSSVSETLEDHEINFTIKSKTEDVINDNLLCQQSEPLMSYTDEVGTDSSEPYKVEDQEEATPTHEELDDIPSEHERPQNAHTDEINASLTSPFTIVASVDDVTSWNNEDKTMKLIATPDIVEIQDESILEEQIPKTPINNEDQAGGQLEEDIASIQAHKESMEAVGETTEPGSALSESLLSQKEQINVHQLFFRSDHEDLKYTAKSTDETEIVEIEELSETDLSTEQAVSNEATGESFENVQRFDVQINAPNTDPPQGPVRRKFGSSRRSKVRKDDTEVAPIYKEDALNIENQNVASTINVELDTQSEPIKEVNIKTDNEVDAAVTEMTLLNDKVELDQMKEQLLEVEANILGLDETLVDDGIHLTEQCTSNESVISEVDKDGNQRENVVAVQIPHTDDSPQLDATASVGDSSAVDSQLIGKGRRQDHDELKPKEININTEMARNGENQAAAPDKLDKSATQVHNETWEAVEPLITYDESLKPKEVPSLFGAEQIDDDILNITDSQVLDTEILEQTVEKSPKPEDNSEQSKINTESFPFKQTVNVHQLTYISDSETPEEMDYSSLQQAEQQDREETLEETSENSALINMEVNTSDSDTLNGQRGKLDSSQRTMEVISTPDIEEIQDESILEEQGPKTPMNNKDQADGQHEMDIAPIQAYNESMKAGGETTGSVLSESLLPLKEQTNAHQLYFSSDHEDMKYTAKTTDGTGIVEIEELAETELSTEQPVTNEMTGETFENVQRLDVQINAPDTDPHQGPVKRKFGSSRRSKARKDDTEVATVYKEDPPSTESQNLTSSINDKTDTQSESIKEEENVKADIEVAAAVRELTPSNDKVELDQMKEKIIEVEANILVLGETVVDDGFNQTEQCTSNEDKYGDQIKNVITGQIPHTDDSTQQDDDVGDGTVVDSQLIGRRKKIGSSRRIKERRRDNNELNPKEIDIKIEMAMDDENQAAVPDKLDKSVTQVQKETLEAIVPPITNDESLKPTEVTSFGAEQIANDDILNITDSQVLDTEILEHTIEESPEPKDFSEQSVVSTESYPLKQTVNVHQLTYISDSETHEEMDDSSVQQTKQQDHEETMGETSENSALINMEVNTSDSDTHKGLRRKLGSSRRTKGAKFGVILSDSKDTSNDNEDISRVPEFVEACPVEEISTDFVSELDAEPINQGIFTKSDSERKKDAELLLLLDKDPSVNSTREKVSETQVRSPVEKTTHDTQKEIPDVEVESFIIKDLKDEGLVQPKGLPRDVGVDSTSPSVAESEEITEAKVDDAIQSFAMSTKGITKEQEGTEVMEFLEARPEVQIKSETKRRKMGSTRRSQLNRKQQDEEINTEDSATILLKKDITVSEYAQVLPSDIFENQGKATISEDQIKNQHLNEDIAERQEVTQEDKEKILQTQTELVQDIDKGATMQTLLPISGEEIQPSSPGKRRKMGSTRKNLSSKQEREQAESVTPDNSEKEEVASLSNDKESKENSGLLVYTATVHQPPPDEDTPLSQPVSQEKLRSESKEAELSSQHEAMSEDAAVARRRKMGSHRKPHSDQSIREEKVTDSGESQLPPLREKSPKLTQISEVNEGDNKALSSDSAFNIKLNSRPMSEKISQQPSLQSTNVLRVQERNIRISAGSDRSASRYEVVMIGDSSVGKTSFIQRAQSGKFSLDIPASIGMDSYKWTVVVNGKTIVLHLWDTAGQERFRSMTKQIFHRAQAFLLMYDVTCVQTFTAVSYWANCIKDGAAENAVVLLLGNKCDRTERKVRREDGEILAEENSFAFMECSAATGENVTEALETVARLLSEKADKREEPLILRKPEPKNKLGCC